MTTRAVRRNFPGPDAVVSLAVTQLLPIVFPTVKFVATDTDDSREDVEGSAEKDHDSTHRLSEKR